MPKNNLFIDYVINSTVLIGAHVCCLSLAITSFELTNIELTNTANIGLWLEHTNVSQWHLLRWESNDLAVAKKLLITLPGYLMIGYEYSLTQSFAEQAGKLTLELSPLLVEKSVAVNSNFFWQYMHFQINKASNLLHK